MVANRRLKRSQPVATKMTDEEIEAQFTEMIENAGGLEYIKQTFDLYRERRQRMDDQYDDLVKKYPDQWVAIAEREEPYVAGSSKELRAILDEKGIDRNTAAMKFIRDQPRLMIRQAVRRGGQQVNRAVSLRYPRPGKFSHPATHPTLYYATMRTYKLRTTDCAVHYVLRGPQ